jgi:hypothetical protein
MDTKCNFGLTKASQGAGEVGRSGGDATAPHGEGDAKIRVTWSGPFVTNEAEPCVDDEDNSEERGGEDRGDVHGDEV